MKHLERTQAVKYNIDYILTGLAVAAIGGGALALSAHSSTTASSVATQFTANDTAVFDRNFEIADRNCDVGYAAQKLCFERTALEDRIEVGEMFPETMYPLALEWRANLALERKADNLKTVRIGQSIILMERDTRMVVDKMDLSGQRHANADTTAAG